MISSAAEAKNVRTVFWGCTSLTMHRGCRSPSTSGECYSAVLPMTKLHPIFHPFLAELILLRLTIQSALHVPMFSRNDARQTINANKPKVLVVGSCEHCSAFFFSSRGLPQLLVRIQTAVPQWSSPAVYLQFSTPPKIDTRGLNFYASCERVFERG